MLRIKQILISKHYYSVRGRELELFRSYLYNRTQRVCFNGIYSKLVDIEWSVLQGSALGTLLFLITTNDLPINISCESTLLTII